MSKLSKANVKKTLHYLKRNGIRNTCYAIAERISGSSDTAYQFVPVSLQVLEKQRNLAMQLSVTFSIVVPAYRTGENYLRELITCVKNQTYPRWELILADATEDDSVEKLVHRIAQDSRVRYVHLSENGGISENTNKALTYASGDYIGLLDHDDVLTEDALYEMAVAIEKKKRDGIEIQMLYSDEDKCDGEGKHFFEPNMKPDFNLDLLLSNNYICHFLVMKQELIKELGFRSQYEGAQDYDLVLRGVAKLQCRDEKILHIPKVLYHWRCHNASTAENPQSKMYAYEAGCRALQDFADRQGWKATVQPLQHLGFYQMIYKEGALAQRKDLGAVGGRLLIGNRTAGGGMTADGEILYQGLRKGYSGYLHRAVLSQNVEALDIRCIQVKQELWPLFQEVTGVPYQTIPRDDLFDVETLPEGTDYVQLSLKLSEAIRSLGYRLLYTPDRVEGWNAGKRRIKR